MSEIRVTTLKDTAGGNSSTAEQIFNGRSKAWVNFNGVGTVGIRADFNVNSITDLNTGYYTINFSSSLSDANYVVSGSATPNTQPDVTVLNVFGQNAYPTSASDYEAPTSSSFRVATSRQDSVVYYDAQIIMLNVQR